jgi:hypothetical protein
VLKVNPHVLVVHSTSCGLPDGDGQKLTMGRLYAHLWHGGNESVAAKAMLRGEAHHLPTHIRDALKGAPRAEYANDLAGVIGAERYEKLIRPDIPQWQHPPADNPEPQQASGQDQPPQPEPQQAGAANEAGNEPDPGPRAGQTPEDAPKDAPEQEPGQAAEEPAGSTNVQDRLLPEAGFYDQRDVLWGIRDYAHSRAVSADATLYATLSRISAMVPKECRVATGIGSPMGASLNLFVAVVGPPGTTKSSSASVARDVFIPDPLLDFGDSLPIGSGEGIAEAFMGEVEEETGELHKRATAMANAGDPKTIKVRKQVRHNVFLMADEGEAFTELQERAGSTLGMTVRSAWMGNTLGNQNATRERNRIIPEGSYSLGMFIGFQPETIQPLLDDQHTGTNQRFIYVSAEEPSIRGRPRPRTTSPATPEVFHATASKMHLVDAVADEVWDAHVTGVVGESTLEAHKNLTRIKLAGLLALLESRQVISDDDWRLAGIMWDTSCKVRDHYIDVAKQRAARERLLKNQHSAEREYGNELARRQVREADEKIRRVARLIAGYVHNAADPATTVSEARRRLKADLRDWGLVNAAAGLADEEGWIEKDDSNLTPGPSRPTEAGR